MRKSLLVMLGVLLVMPLEMPSAAAEPERYIEGLQRVLVRPSPDRPRHVRPDDLVRGRLPDREGLRRARLLVRPVTSPRLAASGGRVGIDAGAAGAKLYGVINDLGNGEFTLDPGLETGHFEATTRWSGARAGGARPSARSASRDLVALGEVTTYREAYSYTFDCYRVRYSGRSENVQAKARGILTFLR